MRLRPSRCLGSRWSCRAPRRPRVRPAWPTAGRPRPATRRPRGGTASRSNRSSLLLGGDVFYVLLWVRVFGLCVRIDARGRHRLGTRFGIVAPEAVALEDPERIGRAQEREPLACRFRMRGILHQRARASRWNSARPECRRGPADARPVRGTSPRSATARPRRRAPASGTAPSRDDGCGSARSCRLAPCCRRRRARARRRPP